MADEITFVETGAQSIYNTVIMNLMDYCGEALYPADERRIFGEALVAVVVGLYNDFNDKARQRMLQYARGAVLDAIGDRYNVKRAAATSATATFRFTVSATQATNIIIPIGTRVTADGDVYFATTAAAVIQAGEISVDVEGACTVGGAQYNGYTEGQISTLVDLIPYVSAANITATEGGDDGEPYNTVGDNRYRERIRLAPASFSTAGAESSYRFHVLKADADIVDVAIISPSATVVNIYPLLSGGVPADDATIEKVVEALNGDVRPLTDKVNVIAPSQSFYNIDIRYYCEASNEAAVIEAIEGDGGAIDKYVEWQRGALGRSINPDRLRHFILEAGATRVDVSQPVYTNVDDNAVAALEGFPNVSHETE